MAASRSREAQDAFAVRSHHRAAEAIASGRFAAEVVPVLPAPVLVKPRHRALRAVPTYVDYAHQIMEHCPQAWVINYTNPMIRICDAIHRHSAIKVVGLCHQILVGYGMDVAYSYRQLPFVGYIPRTP